ncbi:DNA double-strand break repair nuclease NurA [Rhizobium johnstonii]|uniref:DNA double-strand break repair nuclease NurA n=1 Tax=Rhizobium johnstonii TaxID=3019933 RepID=UPI003F9ADE5A
MAGDAKELIVIRSLTSSDLGLFAAHRNSASSKQRAVNINSKIAERLLSPEIYQAGGTTLDCVCTLGDFSDRSARYFGKIHKNWRLGGSKLEGQIFSRVDSVDFALIRSIEGNDGTAPVSLTFIARDIDPAAHARLAALVEGRISQSMIVFDEDQEDFGALAAYVDAPPKPPQPPTRVPKFEPVRVAEVAPMPTPVKPSERPLTIREKLRSSHFMEQMLRVSGDLSAPAQLQFMDTVEQLASQLRTVLLKTGRIITIPRNHAGLWRDVAGQKIGFVDGGMANLSMLGSAPIAVRVGGYIVTPGDRTEGREQFIPLKMLISELYAAPEGGVYNGAFPDLGALRDAARISVEAAGGVRVIQEVPDVKWLFLHGALINPVSRYTDVMRDERVRYPFPNFSPEALSELLGSEGEARSGRDANFLPVYLRQLELLQRSEAVVCGVVERESHTSSAIRSLIESLDDDDIRSVLPLPPAIWKDWFLTTIDPRDDGDGEDQRITDSLLFRCVLEPGEALVPVIIDRNEMRRAPRAWHDVIERFPKPRISFLKPTEWSPPIRLEIFEKDAARFTEVATLILHSALLLPRYAFPVGLDIVDKFAKIPNWMSRPVNTNTAVQALKGALERGDTRLFDTLRRIMCGSKREWLLRPGAFNQ